MKRKLETPSVEEMQELANASECYKSHLFKWQLDQLLKVIQFDVTPVKSVLFEIKKTLEQEEMTNVQNIAIPYPEPIQLEGVHLKYASPASIRVIGSCMTNTMIRSKYSNVDLAVEMPKCLFDDKDHLNHRYLYKRAYYLGCIASILKKQFPQYSYQFHYFLNNEWKPILLINTESLLIRIMPTICESLFFPARLGPSRNSLRPAFLKLNHEPQPTPFYNNSILMDASYQNHVAHIYKAIKEEGPVAETIQLLKRWVLLRDIHDISPFLVSMLFIGFLNNSYQIISKEKKSLNLSRKWSCFQLFRVFLEFMGNLNVSDAIILCNDQEIQKRIVPANQPTPFTPQEQVDSWKNDMMKAFDVVILDPSGCVNLAAGIRRDTWKWFLFQCKLSATLLNVANSNDEDTFDALFTAKPLEGFLKFDHLVQFELENELEQDSILMPENNMEIWDCANQLDKVVAKRIAMLLEMAFGPKISQILVMVQNHKDWSIDVKFEKAKVPIKIGLNINYELSLRTNELGPSVDESKELSTWNGFDIPKDYTPDAWFRHIWGELSELRKFKDGVIRESVVWDLPAHLKDAQDHIGWQYRAKVFPEAVKYIISRHVGTKSINYSGATEWTSLLDQADKASVQSFQPVIVAFNLFSKQLRDLADLPLAILNVFPAHSALCYSSVFIPQPHEYSDSQYYEECLDIVLELQSSTKWPNDYKALQAIKSELLLDISKRLTDKYSDVQCQMVTKACVNGDATSALDVMISNGYTFRCHIKSPVESFLLSKIDPYLNQSETIHAKEIETMQVLWSKYFEFVSKPIWTQTLQGLIQRYPVLSHTIRLVKRWISTHGLLHHLSDMIVEMICVKATLDPNLPNVGTSYCGSTILEMINDGSTLIGSGWSGFMKVIAFLSSWSWKDSCLLIDIVKLKGKSDEDEDNMEGWQECVLKIFKDLRQQDPSGNNCAMFIAANFPHLVKHLEVVLKEDTSKQPNVAAHIASIFTFSRPHRMIVDRLTTLAKHVLHSNVKKAFNGSLSKFDVVLHLNDEFITRKNQQIHLKKYLKNQTQPFKNLKDQSRMPDFDPVGCFLNDLQILLGEHALLFHDKFGGATIGISFNPAIYTMPRPFKPSVNFMFTPLSEKKNGKEVKCCVASISSIVESIRCLGDGILKDVVVLMK